MIKRVCLFLAAVVVLHSSIQARQAATSPQRLTGILKSIDPKTGSFTLASVGADIDQVLLDKTRAEGKAPAGPDAPKAAPADSREFRINAKTEIRIVFRMSPSVANSLERSLADLEPMIGHPVSLELGPTPFASRITVWRGTSRKAG